jgi:hypothetical protein
MRREACGGELGITCRDRAGCFVTVILVEAMELGDPGVLAALEDSAEQLEREPRLLGSGGHDDLKAACARPARWLHQPPALGELCGADQAGRGDDPEA